MIGCPTGTEGRKLYSWDLSDIAPEFTEAADCAIPQGHFSVQDESTILMTGNNKQIWKYDDNGYAKINGPRFTVSHNIGDSFTLPSGTITCD